jgi:predicted F0F1-ATPase subunit
MNSKEQNKKRLWIKDVNLTSLGWELALPIFLGAFLGYQIDRHFNLKYTFTLILLIFGIFAGYYNLYKIIELELLRTKAAKLYQQKDKSNS